MLKSLRINNFKSFKDSTLEFSPFTLLIGANASGKSNAIEALRLTNWLCNGQAINSLPQKISQDPEFRGSGLSFFDEKDKKQEIFLEMLEGENFTEFKYSLAENNAIYHLVEEEFTYNKSPIYTKVYDAQSMVSKYVLNFFGAETIYFTDTADTLQLYTIDNLDFKKESNADSTSIREKRRQALIELQNLFILNVNPQIMRNYASKSNLVLQGSGENLSAILFDLCSKKENKSKLLKLIESIPEQNIKDIKFIETERGDVMVRLLEVFNGKEKLIDAPLLSDGTLRALAIGAYLLFLKEGSLLVIEEIDNGIHPSRVKHLLNKIYAIAKERKIQILMTSHNSVLLDSMPLESLQDVIVCFRDKEEGDSRFTRLGDLTQYSELVAQGSLGTIVTKGLVEKFVHDKRTAEEIRAESLIWLENFTKKVEAI